MEIQYLKTVLLVATHLNFSKVAEEIPCAPSFWLWQRVGNAAGLPQCLSDGRKGNPPEQRMWHPSFWGPSFLRAGGGGSGAGLHPCGS